MAGKWRFAALAAALAAAAFLVTFLLLRGAEKPSELTAAAAEREVLEQYGGEIVQSRADGDGYKVTLQSSEGLYELTVAGAEARILSITRLESSKPEATETPGLASPSASPATMPAGSESPAATDNPDPGESANPTAPGATPDKPEATPPAPKPTGSPSVHISEVRAAELALQKVPGKVQDVDKEREDGQWYYFVEIETNDLREAEVQLNAVTGTVISVAWDDADDDDDDD